MLPVRLFRQPYCHAPGVQIDLQHNRAQSRNKELAAVLRAYSIDVVAARTEDILNDAEFIP